MRRCVPFQAPNSTAFPRQSRASNHIVRFLVNFSDPRTVERIIARLKLQDKQNTNSFRYLAGQNQLSEVKSQEILSDTRVSTYTTGYLWP